MGGRCPRCPIGSAAYGCSHVVSDSLMSAKSFEQTFLKFPLHFYDADWPYDMCNVDNVIKRCNNSSFVVFRENCTTLYGEMDMYRTGPNPCGVTFADIFLLVTPFTLRLTHLLACSACLTSEDYTLVHPLYASLCLGHLDWAYRFVCVGGGAFFGQR